MTDDDVTRIQDTRTPRNVCIFSSTLFHCSKKINWEPGSFNLTLMLLLKLSEWAGFSLMTSSRCAYRPELYANRASRRSAFLTARLKMFSVRVSFYSTSERRFPLWKVCVNRVRAPGPVGHLVVNSWMVVTDVVQSCLYRRKSLIKDIKVSFYSFDLSCIWWIWLKCDILNGREQLKYSSYHSIPATLQTWWV